MQMEISLLAHFFHLLKVGNIFSLILLTIGCQACPHPPPPSICLEDSEATRESVHVRIYALLLEAGNS